MGISHLVRSKEDGKQKERGASFVTQESAFLWKRTILYDSVLCTGSTSEHDCIIIECSPRTDGWDGKLSIPAVLRSRNTRMGCLDLSDIKILTACNSLAF